MVEGVEKERKGKMALGREGKVKRREERKGRKGKVGERRKERKGRKGVMRKEREAGKRTEEGEG